MSKPIRFKDVKVNTAFTPAPGEVGQSQVYIKRPNGICPVVSRDNKRDDTIEFGRFTMEAIFYPEDRVYASYLPPKILDFYNR